MTTKRMMLFAALVVASACAEKKPAPPREAVPVTVATVTQKDVPLELRAIGNVTPVSNVAVRALVGGQLLRVWFREGDDVRQGQTLFSIDPRPLQAELQQAQANLARDEANLRNAESQTKRYAELVKKDFVTKEEYDRIASGAEAGRATIAGDRAAVETARLQLSYCEIRSPLSGRTGSLQVHVGNLVKANDTTPLVVINQIEPVQVQFSVPSSELARIRARGAEKIEVIASTDAGSAPVARGTLTFIDNGVDPQTGTIALKATFPNHDRALWPGQFVNIGMVVDRRNGALVVPAPAVQTGQRGQYVYVVKPGNAVEMRPVSVFRTIQNDAIIESGLAAGETVVTDGQLRLTPKSKVEVKRGS